MKKLISWILLFACTAPLLAGCGQAPRAQGSTLAPLELTQREEQLINLLEAGSTTHYFFTLQIPEDARCMRIVGREYWDGELVDEKDLAMSLELSGEALIRVSLSPRGAVQVSVQFDAGGTINGPLFADAEEGSASPFAAPMGWSLPYLQQTLEVEPLGSYPLACTLLAAEGGMALREIGEYHADPVLFREYAGAKMITLEFTDAM